jgi:heme oxygenase
MTPEVNRMSDNQTLVAQLRKATWQLHVSLHEHPLIVELLTRPSLDSYRAALEGFLRVYEPAEPALVECARRFGAAAQYPRPERTDYLLADLATLNCNRPRIGLRTKRRSFARLSGIGDLVGCLYVIKGSALGGYTIIRKLNRSLDVQRCCRFFTGDGERTNHVWRKFQAFCNDSCPYEEARQAALASAKRLFLSIAECLTWSMEQSRI